MRKRPLPPAVKPQPSPFAAITDLSPFIIRGMAARKGVSVETVTKGESGRRFVTLADRDGSMIDNKGRYVGFTLWEAKLYLDQLPDRSS